jgi:endoglucanase
MLRREPIYQYTGVNLAGAEFTAQEKLPGVYEHDYIYPTPQEVDYFIAQGMNTIRLPFSWENLQPQPNGDLNPDELKRIEDFVSYATGKGAYVILNPHNYGRYFGKPLGGSDAPADLLPDFWSRLAQRFAGNPKVIFGIMNEPYEIDSRAWLDISNKTLAAIRQAGASNLVLVPGVDYSKAASWGVGANGDPNGLVLQEVSDPGHNFAIEIHNYLDEDASGRNPACVSATIGVERLRDVTSWLRVNGLRGFLGEFGATSDKTCLDAMDQMLTHMQDNADVWLGWTYWAAGPWWKDYMFSIEPVSNAPAQPQLTILLKHLAKP